MNGGKIPAACPTDAPPASSGPESSRCVEVRRGEVGPAVLAEYREPVQDVDYGDSGQEREWRDDLSKPPPASVGGDGHAGRCRRSHRPGRLRGRAACSGRRPYRESGRERPRRLYPELRHLSSHRSPGQLRIPAFGGGQLPELLGRPHAGRAVGTHQGFDAPGPAGPARGPGLPRHRRVPASGERRAGRGRGAYGYHGGVDRYRGNRGNGTGAGDNGAGPGAGVDAGHADRDGDRGGRADGGGRSRELHAGHRRAVAQPRSGRLADGSAELPGLEPQPPHRDRSGQRRGARAGLDVGHERRRTERALADRARRRALFRQLRPRRAGARREHRRPDLGARGGRRGRSALELEPQSRDLPGQAVPGHGRCAADRARRAHRRGGLDHPSRRRRPGLPQHQRPGHRRGQGGAGARGLRAVHP